MIAPVDRTGEFLAALASHHPRPDKEAPLIQPTSPNPQHEFTAVAQQLTQKMTEMGQFVDKCDRRYRDFSRRGMSEQQRDGIDAAVGQFLRTAVGEIETLKQQAVDGMEAKGDGSSFAAHQLGVVVILNEDLQQVSAKWEGLRGVRIRHAMEDKGRKTVEYDVEVAREMREERRRRDGDAPGDTAGVMEREFQRENMVLMNELLGTRQVVREAERTVLEIAQLNHVFAAKVLEQAREIETLYELAVEATESVQRGNRELRKMRKRGPVLKYALAALALFLALMLLLQEWIARRTFGLL